MPKKFLRKWMPSRRDIGERGGLRRIFGALLFNPDVWHLNRYSVAWAVSVGLFMAFVPVPFQMALAAGAAILIGCNLPISVALVWISNPITMPPIFYGAYKLGAWVLDVRPKKFNFELSFDWLLTELAAIWQPFLLGCFIAGVAAALLGHIAVRIIWRIHVVVTWRERRRLRRERLRP